MTTERPFSLADAAKYGAYAGIAAVLIALVGMIEAFSKRMIIADVISMAQVMLLAVAFVGAMFAASKAQRTNRGIALPAGIVAGAITALFVAVLALSIVPLNLRNIFVNATPQLVKLLLPFDLTGLTGAAVLIGLGALTGLVAAAISYLPASWRNSLLISVGAVILLALLEDVFVAILPKNIGRFIYRSNGLTLVGAASLFVIFLVVAYLWLANRGAVTRRG
jgi:hypothetical protein